MINLFVRAYLKEERLPRPSILLYCTLTSVSSETDTRASDPEGIELGRAVP
jgi:hypothetical protein